MWVCDCVLFVWGLLTLGWAGCWFVVGWGLLVGALDLSWLLVRLVLRLCVGVLASWCCWLVSGLVGFLFVVLIGDLLCGWLFGLSGRGLLIVLVYLHFFDFVFLLFG